MGELSNYARQNAEQYRDTRAEEAAKKEAENALALQRVSEFVMLMKQHDVQPHALYEYSGQSKIPLKKLLKSELTPSILMPVGRIKELQRTYRQYRVYAEGWHIMSRREHLDDSWTDGIFVTVDGELTGTTIDTDYETTPFSSTVVKYGMSQESILSMLVRDDALDRMASMLAGYGILKSL